MKIHSQNFPKSPLTLKINYCSEVSDLIFFMVSLTILSQ